MNAPFGYLKTPNVMSDEMRQHIAAQWQRYVDKLQRGEPAVLLLDREIEFVPFAGQAVPNAICRYCWSPNLHTSTHCEKCSAPLLEVA